MADQPKLDPYLPPVGFYFQINISGNAGGPSAAFQEISGISAKMETETIVEGGDNRFTHRVPGRVKYEDLVLKRGLLIRNAPLTKWCMDAISGGLRQSIQPKNIVVTLSDEAGEPIMRWNFVNAFPVKWEVSGFAAAGNDLAVESLVFSYNYFYINDELPANNA